VKKAVDSNVQEKAPAIRAFPSTEAWADWLARNHQKSSGVWFKIYKKASGKPAVDYQEILDVAICHGWIDGQRKGFDDEAYLQKFTPRRKGSVWSKINQDKALRLIREGRMQPAGLRAIQEAKENGRWSTTYSLKKTAAIPADLEAALIREPKAAEFFKTLKSRNRYAILFRIQTCKKSETRQKKIAAFVEMLKAGKTIYPEPS